MKNLHNKLLSRGAASLSDAELLAMLVESSGDARDPQQIADGLLRECGSLQGVARSELGRLRMVEGIGMRRAERLVVAAEIGRRVAMTNNEEVVSISTDADVVRLMRPLLEHLKYEECWALYLTSSNRVIEQQRISQGGVQGTVVDHKLIVKRALELLATRLVLVHNHPSEAASPSEADRRLTRRLKEAAGLFDIQLLDHLIIAREGDYSFKREGLL